MNNRSVDVLLSYLYKNKIKTEEIKTISRLLIWRFSVCTSIQMAAIQVCYHLPSTYCCTVTQEFVDTTCLYI